MIYSSVDEIKGEVELELQVGDLDARVVTETEFIDFGTIESTDTLAVNQREMWLHSDQENLLAMNDASIFYADFPPLPDFPFMSSSSSSSPTPASAKTTMRSYSSTSASSSYAASWAILKSDAEKDLEKMNSHYCIKQCDLVDAPPPALLSTTSIEYPQPTDPSDHCVGVGDSMNVMETCGYMDLLENNDFFDPYFIFQNDENPLEEFTHEKEIQLAPIVHHQPSPQQQEAEKGDYKANGEGDLDGEMRTVFLEWLKSNKDSISANELRSVKLQKSTIECAVRHLGGGKEAMKKLLKLILKWVQTSHLQNKKRKENSPSNVLTQFKNPGQYQNTDPTSNLNHQSSSGPESNTYFNQSLRISPPPYGADLGAMVPLPQPMVGNCVGDPYTNGASNNINGCTTAAECQMLESAHSWPHSQFTVASHYNQSFGDKYNNLHPYQFFHDPGDKLMRLGPFATKEARKKRMARKRRYLSHHKHHNHHGQQQNQNVDPRMGSDNCTAVVAPHVNPANCVYWQGSVASVMPAEPTVEKLMMDQMAIQNQNYHHGRVSSARRQVAGHPFDSFLSNGI